MSLTNNCEYCAMYERHLATLTEERDREVSLNLELRQLLYGTTLDYENGPPSRSSLREQVKMLEAERDRLKDGLEEIVKHQQIVGGSMSIRSSVTMIATKTLTPQESDKCCGNIPCGCG